MEGSPTVSRSSVRAAIALAAAALCPLQQLLEAVAMPPAFFPTEVGTAHQSQTLIPAHCICICTTQEKSHVSIIMNT